MNDNSCMEMMQLLAMKAIKPKDVLRTYREQQERLWELNAADFLEIRPEHREADVRALHTFNAARAWHDATCGVLRLAPVLRP